MNVTNNGNAVEVYGRSGKWYLFDSGETLDVLPYDAAGLVDHPDFVVDIPLEDEDSSDPGAEEGDDEE